MKTINKETKLTARMASSFVMTFLLLGTAAPWLMSCSTPPTSVGMEGTGRPDSTFPINVQLYSQPVEVAAWTLDPAKTVNPEGAALNVVTAMQRGDVDAWLECWSPAERPQMTASERRDLLERWEPLKDGRIHVTGRVVAAANIIEEISVQGRSQSPLQIPLKHEGGKWWLTKMDVNDEYMQWQTSRKKLVESIDPDAFRHYLDDAHAHDK